LESFSDEIDPGAVSRPVRDKSMPLRIHKPARRPTISAARRTIQME
jgi:hypothetical protein